VGFVAMVAMFLLGPGSPTGEKAGLTYLYAFIAMIYMLPAILLIAVVEGLWFCSNIERPVLMAGDDRANDGVTPLLMRPQWPLLLRGRAQITWHRQLRARVTVTR
jgi:hypothetical protein